jgi:molecular chaperone HscA
VKPSYGLTDVEVEEMLLASIDNAQQDIEERMLIEKRVEARRIIAATNKAIDEDGALLAADERNAIQASIAALEEAIAGTDRNVVQAKTEELDQVTQGLAQKRMSRRIAEALENKSVDDVLHDARTGALR